MKYSIVVTDIAKEMINEISDNRVKKKISERIDQLADSPDLQGKPLKGKLSGYRSLRAVGQRYRIVYRVYKEKIVVYVVGVGIRKAGKKKDVYNRLKKLIEDIRLDSTDSEDKKKRR